MAGVIRHFAWFVMAYGSVGCLWATAQVDDRSREESQWLRDEASAYHHWRDGLAVATASAQLDAAGEERDWYASVPRRDCTAVECVNVPGRP